MKPGASLRLLFLIAAVVLTACRQTVVLDQSADGGGQEAGGNGGKGGSGEFDGGWMSYDAHSDQWRLCGSGQVLPLAPRYPDVMITLDRSAAMQAPFENGTRLEIVESELRALISTYAAVIRFGYEEFPSSTDACTATQGCCAGATTIVAPSRNILPTTLDRWVRPCTGGPSCASNQRPTADALKQVYDLYGRSLDMTVHNRYVLLITGGDPSCQADGSLAASCMYADEKVKTLQNQNKSVKTFVIGVGQDVANSDCLNTLAMSGRTDAATAEFPATKIDLRMSLGRIAREIADDACRIDVPMPPADPNKATLWVNNTRVTPDPVNGWDFGPSGNTSSITLHGAACVMFVSVPNPELELLSDCMPFHP